MVAGQNDENLMHPNYNLGLSLIEGRYRQFLLSLSAKVNMLIGNAGLPIVSIRSFQSFAEMSKEALISSVRVELDQVAEKTAKEAHDAIIAELGGERNIDDQRVMDNSALIFDTFIRNLRSQADVDAQIALSVIRRVLLTPSKSKGDIEFSYTDRGGKRWKSDVYIRALWRMTNVSIATDAALITMQEYGVKTAYIVHSDDKHPSAGVSFDVGGDEWPSLYSKFFHPNTQAWISTRSPT